MRSVQGRAWHHKPVCARTVVFIARAMVICFPYNLTLRVWSTALGWFSDSRFLVRDELCTET